MATATCLLIPTPTKLQNRYPNAPRLHHSPVSKFTCSSLTAQSQSAKRHLLGLISDQDRGLKTQKDPAKRASIVEAIDAMAVLGRDTVTTGGSLSATWRLLWTTEKEQLFIIENARLFGTLAGDVLQVIDFEKRTLNNVITFPPDGVFFVRSDIEIASPQRVNFRCNKFGLNYVEDLQVQFYGGKAGRFHYRHLGRVGECSICDLYR